MHMRTHTSRPFGMLTCHPRPGRSRPQRHLRRRALRPPAVRVRRRGRALRRLRLRRRCYRGAAAGAGALACALGGCG
jgi:hypothetical protein